MTSTLSSRLTAVLLPAAISLAAAMPALAQGQPPLQQQMAPQSPQQTNNVCTRLEAQLADVRAQRPRPGAHRADQEIRDRGRSSSRRNSTASMRRPKRRAARAAGFFSIFSGQSAACGPLNSQISQMKGNLDRIHGDLARLQGSDPPPSAKASAARLLGALAQNDCGPQYRQARGAAAAARRPVRVAVRPGHALFSGTTVQGENTPQARAIAPSACACATATTTRSRIRPRRASSSTTRGPARLRARPPKRSSSPTAIPARTSTRPFRQGGQLYTAHPQRLPIPAVVRQRLQLQTRRRVMVAGAQGHPGPDTAGRRRRGERGPRQADVAAARRRAGQADQARNSAAARPSPIRRRRPRRLRRRPGSDSGRRAGQGDARSEQAGAPGRPDLHRALTFRNRTLRSSPRRRS